MDEENKMNRLVLVGNGFDLAHDIKTSYNHFILDYIISCFTKALNDIDMMYADDALDINTTSCYNWPSIGFNSLTELITHLYDTGQIKDLFTRRSFRNGNMILENNFNINFNMPFIEHLIRNCSETNWVDIENEYYEKLKGILIHSSKKEKTNDILKLNSAMKWVIDKLQLYLTKLNINDKFNMNYENLIQAPIDNEDFADEEYYSHNNINIKQTMILNFNYTSTIEQYVSNGGIMYDGITVNYIHGKLNTKDNPIIFGFGDELDSDYTTLELDKAKGLFEYIKSFWYFRTSNYYNLIRFIDSNDFQVYVLGHSCGLSDRTMLNMIFEHDHCKSIKIFYHGTEEDNNYTALTQEISRHFKDKRLMRRRIVSLDRSSPMPQAW